MNHHFCSESDSRSSELRKKLDLFYESTKEYSAFQEANFKPDFWQPIKSEIVKCLSSESQCRILEFGAGCTGFGDYLSDIREKVIFDVQDVTKANLDYLSTQANNVYIGDVLEIKENYNIIFSTFVYEHITNPKIVLDHLISLLNEGGSIFIACPRYDFPLYLSPSAKHLSKWVRLKIAIWLISRRLKVSLTKKPDFLIHLDPAVFHQEWFRDADAIHWVSLYDLKSYLPSNLNLKIIRQSAQGWKGKIYASFMLLFVQIIKPSK